MPNNEQENENENNIRQGIKKKSINQNEYKFELRYGNNPVFTPFLQQTDVLGRRTAKEFLLISKDANEQVNALAEKLRQALQQRTIFLAGRIIASVGISTYRLGGNMQALIGRADSALYTTNDTGRYGIEGECQLNLKN